MHILSYIPLHRTHFRTACQVLEQYCQYADGMHGRWAVKEDGHAEPSVRTMIKPLLNLFHGEKGSKK